MDSLLTWRYFLIPQDKFEEIKDKAEVLDSLRDRELSEEENETKESLIDEINKTAPSIARKVVEYKDTDGTKDGTIVSELVYRMDEAREVQKYSEGFYFKFLVHITPEDLQKEYPTIGEIFEVTENLNLLREEFLGKWEYLERAKEIFGEIRNMYREAYESKCGVIKTDTVEWVGTGQEELPPDAEESSENPVT
jgi:DNA-binding transcriptional ArsR family regulator